MMHRNPGIAIGLLLAAITTADSAQGAPADPFDEILVASLNDRKGVMIYIDG